MLENEVTGLVNIVSWKTKKIARVCRSVKGAETRALQDALDDAIYTAKLVKQIYTGEIDLNILSKLLLRHLQTVNQFGKASIIPGSVKRSYSEAVLLELRK